ncbi:MAG: hypothetical protein ACOY3P_14995 [Planctomycetota bacterium]
MMRVFALLCILWAVSSEALGADSTPAERVATVAATKGLIAFWDFALTRDVAWTSYRDEAVVDRQYPVYLRRIGDPKSYDPDTWPYKDDDSRLRFDTSGPFGHALRCNKGYIFAEVPRSAFDRTPLDVHGREPFTLIAWIRFVGKRHLVAGIWDEGGWDKYGGRRQVALFGGLFGSQGVIAHISATGASSYPQSTARGSQYARARAIDGGEFTNGQWVALAMTFNPEKHEVVAYLDGQATASTIVDPVARDVFGESAPTASNPFHFPWPIYSPRSFVLKFNGYDIESSGVYEHWLEVDADQGTIRYDRSSPSVVRGEYRVQVDLDRDEKSLLETPLAFAAVSGATVRLPNGRRMAPGDTLVTRLEVRENNGDWRPVGSEIRYQIREGAPFTFGRALGLGTEPIDHGSQIDIDGVAVFNRVLSEGELKSLSFSRR